MQDPRRDEVDELVEAWARERSDLDLAPVAVFSRISRLARHLDLARRTAFTAHGIESWEFDVLAALRRAGAPYELTPGELGASTMITSGAVTKRVDRLIAQGYVDRHVAADDARSRRVRLTRAGLTLIDDLVPRHLANEHRLLAGFTARERTVLAGLLESWGRALDQAEDQPGT